MARGLAFTVALVITSATAAPRMLLVAHGDCSSAELLTLASRFDAALRAKAPARVVPGEAVLEKVRPRSALDPQAFKARLESARSLVYSGKPEQALALLTETIAAADRSTPEAAPWPLLASALATQGLVFKQLDRKADAAEAFKRIVRIDEAYALDPDAFSPSTLRAFDAARKELAHAKKLTLTVHAAPEGADVFVDGRLLGQTPLALKLPGGPYRVLVGKGGRRSFAHPVSLARDETLEVDLAFEGAVAAAAPLCLGPDADEARAASQLGALGSADEVVLFSVDAASPPATRVRASARAHAPGAAPRDYLAASTALEALAGDVLSGAPPRVEAPAVASAAASPEASPITLAPWPTPAAPPRATTSGHPSGARLVSYGLLGAGALGVAVAGTVWILGDSDRTALRALTLPDGTLLPPSDPRHAEALALVSKVDSTQLVTLVTGGVGLGLLVSGALVAWLFPGEAPPVSVAVVAEPGRAGLVLGARF